MNRDDLAIVVGLVLAAGFLIFNLRRRLRKNTLPFMKSPSDADRRKVGAYAWSLAAVTFLISAALAILITLNN